MIITHAANGHLDDFLATALAAFAAQSSSIKRVKHADVEKEKAAMTGGDIMVDIGRELTPEKGVFDHHQDKDLGAAFVHVANHFGFELPEDSLWGYFSDSDTKGQVKARKIHGKTKEEADAIFSIVQPFLKAWDLVLPEGEIQTDMFREVGAYLCKQGFNLTVGELEGIKLIVKSFYPEQFAEAEAQIAEEKAKKEKALKSLEFSEVGGYKVAIHGGDVYLSHEDTQTPVILTLNQRSQKPSLIVDTEVLHVNEILEAMGNPTTDFVHANGFLAVIDDSWENVVNMIKGEG